MRALVLFVEVPARHVFVFVNAEPNEIAGEDRDRRRCGKAEAKPNNGHGCSPRWCFSFQSSDVGSAMQPAVGGC